MRHALNASLPKRECQIFRNPHEYLPVGRTSAIDCMGGRCGPKWEFGTELKIRKVISRIAASTNEREHGSIVAVMLPSVWKAADHESLSVRFGVGHPSHRVWR